MTGEELIELVKWRRLKTIGEREQEKRHYY
jgi:hypothetical protein